MSPDDEDVWLFVADAMSRHPLDPRDEGDPDAELVIEVYGPSGRRHATYLPHGDACIAHGSTTAEALRAARCAVLGIEVVYRKPGTEFDMEMEAIALDESICAAIDAREEKP